MFFSKRKKKGKGASKHNRTQVENPAPLRAVPTKKTKRTKAEEIAAMFPVSPIFADKLNEVVYQSPITEVDKDALRLIRRVSLEKKKNGQVEEKIVFSDIDGLVPEEMRGEVQKESGYLFLVFLEHLLDHFEAEDIATEYKSKMHEVFNNSNFISVTQLLEAIGGDQTRTALVVRCLNQAVAITGHTHIKCNVCGLPTKDLPGERGWRINVVLAEYVQVTHTRREVNVDMFERGKDQWQLEFDVRLTFEKQMSEMTNSSLVITDLQIINIIGEDFENYLKEKFGAGDLVIC